MTLRRTFAAGTLALGLGLPVLAQAQDMPSKIRVGILGGENESDRLTKFACWKDILTKEFGVPVELYPAADYAGTMQAMLAKQVDVAGFGASAYAGMVIQDPQAVELVATVEQLDGSTGYYSVMMVRADSGIEKLDDLKGKSLAFADPNSTSGYLYPQSELLAQGYDPQVFFGRADFSGGHEQTIVAVLNKQYEAGVTWASLQGDESKGYTSGALQKAVEKGQLKMSDIKLIWHSTQIPNGPEVIRADLPEAFKAKYKQVLFDLPTRDPACFNATQGGNFTKFVEVPAGFYDGIIRMRKDQDAARRG